MVKRIASKTEPKLEVHRYVVTVSITKAGKTRTKYQYCANRDEIRAICKKAPVGSVIEVHKADHNFIQAFEKVADRKKSVK